MDHQKAMLLTLLCMFTMTNGQFNTDGCYEFECPICERCILNSFGQPRCVKRPNCCPPGASDRHVECEVDPCADAVNRCPSAAYCVRVTCNGCAGVYYDHEWTLLAGTDCFDNPSFGGRNIVARGLNQTIPPSDYVSTTIWDTQRTTKSVVPDQNSRKSLFPGIAVTHLAQESQTFTSTNAPRQARDNEDQVPNACDSQPCAECYSCFSETNSPGYCCFPDPDCLANRLRGNPQVQSNSLDTKPQKLMRSSNLLNPAQQSSITAVQDTRRGTQKPVLFEDNSRNEPSRTTNKDFRSTVLSGNDINREKNEQRIQNSITTNPNKGQEQSIRSPKPVKTCRSLNCYPGLVCSNVLGFATCMVPEEQIAPALPLSLSKIAECRVAPRFHDCRTRLTFGPKKNWYFDVGFRRCVQQIGRCCSGENCYRNEGECELSSTDCALVPDCPIPNIIPKPSHCRYAGYRDATGCPQIELTCEDSQCATNNNAQPCDICQRCRSVLSESCTHDNINTPLCSRTKTVCVRDEYCEQRRCEGIQCERDSVCRVIDRGTTVCLPVLRTNNLTSAPVNDQSMCTQPIVPGDCFSVLERWAYDPLIRDCRLFDYTGCGGNDNRFETSEQCRSQCAGVDDISRDNNNVRTNTRSVNALGNQATNHVTFTSTTNAQTQTVLPNLPCVPPSDIYLSGQTRCSIEPVARTGECTLARYTHSCEPIESIKEPCLPLRMPRHPLSMTCEATGSWDAFGCANYTIACKHVPDAPTPTIDCDQNEYSVGLPATVSAIRGNQCVISEQHDTDTGCLNLSAACQPLQEATVNRHSRGQGQDNLSSGDKLQELLDIQR